MTEFDAGTARPFVEQILAVIHREYPSHVQHLLFGDEDVATPRRRTPAFFGSFDWHSSVHSHWALVRVLRFFPRADFGARAAAAIAASLTAEHIAREVEHAAPRPTFEMPYGTAWLLLLAAEVRRVSVPEARDWSAALAPLAALIARRFEAWLDALPAPIRTGDHSQSAFAMGLVLDAARELSDRGLEERVRHHALRLHGEDRDLPIHLEPSGFDFLSPSLGVADLMRRVLDTERFDRWLERALPSLARADPEPIRSVRCENPEDLKLVHLDGLLLSRAWMLEGIVAGLERKHRAVRALAAFAAEHRTTGLARAVTAHYSGAHWLASFALYLLSRAGLGASGAAP